MANNLRAKEVTGNTGGNYIQHNTGLQQTILAATEQRVVPVTTANVDLTTGDEHDVNSQLYKALRSWMLIFTGALTGNRDVILPLDKKPYWLHHQCSGGFQITVKTATGSGITLVNGEVKLVRVDGVDVKLVTEQQSPLAGTGEKIESDVAQGAETKAVVFAAPYADTTYKIVGQTASWPTSVGWSAKTINGYTATFGSPAPDTTGNNKLITKIEL